MTRFGAMLLRPSVAPAVVTFLVMLAVAWFAAAQSQSAYDQRMRADVLKELSVVRAKLGHLSSVNALRITMLGVLSKTERKRLAYGRGIAALARLILRAFDVAGLLSTSDADRSIRIEWPVPNIPC